jgi:hypothetical protein
MFETNEAGKTNKTLVFKPHSAACMLQAAIDLVLIE